MKLRSAALGFVVLAVTTVAAQGTSPTAAPPTTPLRPQRRLSAGRAGAPALADSKAAALQGPAALRQRLQDLETTTSSMHALLAQMHAKAGASKSKDPLVKANLDMWDMMIAHLDKEVQELKLAVAAREDLEARRTAMYKQADAKAQAAARAAQAAQQVRFGVMPNPASAAQTTNQSTSDQAPAGQTSVPAATPEPSPK